MGAHDDLRYVPRLGLALGGGGVLGAAHVGVLQVLHERGIAPTAVVGTSAGAIIGGAYAMGADPYHLEDLVCSASWSDFGRLERRPGLGVMSTDALRATLENLGTEHLIEDLPVRYGAVATDVDERTTRLIDHGPLADAMAASMAVPGLFRPVQVGGHRLVDGGVLQNLPIEAAFEMGASHVIAVRLAPEWEAVRSMRTAMQVHAFEIRADVTLITPAFGRASQWVPKELPHLVQLGREAAERALADYEVVIERPPRDPAETPLPADEGRPRTLPGIGSLLRRR